MTVMPNRDLIERFWKWADVRGYRIRYGPVDVQDRARRRVRDLNVKGMITPGFFRDRLAWIEAVQETDFTGSGSLLLVAVPRSFHQVTFMLDEGRFTAVLPPTYVNYDRLSHDVLEDLRSELSLGSGSVQAVRMPLKTVAAYLGLAKYGRNNITYVDGMGSYHQLCGYRTLETLHDPIRWECKEHEMLPECSDCGACKRVCPTGAIRSDRFLLHAETCLTYINEGGGNWPSWLPPGSHNCLMGCMLCQTICPLNRDRMRIEDTGIVFSPIETNFLLEGDLDRNSPLAAQIGSKFMRMAIEYDLEILGRNLRALIRSSQERRHFHMPVRF